MIAIIGVRGSPTSTDIKVEGGRSVVESPEVENDAFTLSEQVLVGSSHLCRCRMGNPSAIVLYRIPRACSNGPGEV